MSPSSQNPNQTLGPPTARFNEPLELGKTAKRESMSIGNFETEACSLAELVMAARTGDRRAQCGLYERYYRATLSHSYQLTGNWDEAEELVQDAFIQAFERLEQLRIPEAFGGWLRQIVRRMAINRQSRRRVPCCAELESMEIACLHTTNPLEDVLDGERSDQVRCGLDSLTELDRMTLEAFYLGGQSLIEMSQRFEAPVGTIKRRLHVARKRLAERIGDLVAI
jgi:RNA polymerase sigma-70 factor, ECF subfamily